MFLSIVFVTVPNLIIFRLMIDFFAALVAGRLFVYSPAGKLPRVDIRSICQGFFLVKFVLFFILIRYILGISLFFIFLEVFSWLRILFVLIL